MKTKFLYSSILLIVVTGLFLGFSTSDNLYKTNTTRSNNPGAPTSYTTPGIVMESAPLNESFESVTFPPTGWTVATGAPDQMWSRQVFGTTPIPFWTGTAAITTPPGGGLAAAYVTYDQTASSNNEWLITPQITNVQTGDSLSFWIRYIVPAYADSFRVRISTTTPTIAAMTVPVYQKRFFGAADTGWVQIKLAIGGLVPNGSNIYIGFQEAVLNNLADGSAFEFDLVSFTNAAAPPPPSQWFAQTSPVTTTLYSVSAPSNNVAWACGASGRVLRTTDGGTWTAVTNPDANAEYCIWGIDANTAVVTSSPASGTFVYKTTNAGVNWTQVFAQTGGFMNGIYFKDANNGMMYGDPVGGRLSLWRTTNGGTTWDSTGQNITTAAAGWNNAMNGVGDNVWIGTNTTAVFKTTNFGTSWATQTAVQTNQYAIWFSNATNGMLGGVELNSTTNGGTNWTAMTSIGTGNVSGITSSGSTWFMIRQATPINKSTNFGANWTVDYTAPAGSQYHITTARGGTNVWAVRSNGGIAKWGISSTLTPINNTVADNYSLSQNYPNPFNPSTSIKFALPTAGFTSLKIYNMLGKEVATLVSSNLSAGTYSYDFNASALSSGIYFYKLESANFSEVKKMSLVK